MKKILIVLLINMSVVMFAGDVKTFTYKGVTCKKIYYKCSRKKAVSIISKLGKFRKIMWNGKVTAYKNDKLNIMLTYDEDKQVAILGNLTILIKAIRRK